MSRVFSELVTLQGQQVLLAVIDPDWSRPFESSARISVDRIMGVTGIQERRPDHIVPRWFVRYRTELDNAELQQVREIAAASDSMLVAIPFWPDAQRTDASGTLWSQRLLNGQCSVSWGDNLQGVQVFDSGSPPSGKFRATLIVGRVKFRFKLFTDGISEVDIELREESPFEMRVTPRATAPAQWDPQWQPNWATLPSQGLSTLNEFAEIGLGRTRIQEGEPGAQRWKQSGSWTLDSDHGANFLAFWTEKTAGHQAFSAPSLSTPGAETPAAPHEFNQSTGRALFDGEIKWSWVTPSLADVVIQVEQQIETPSVNQQPAPIAYLYEFTYGVQTARLTDWEAPVTAGGHTYQPARIEHDRIRNTLKPQQEECQLKVALDDLPLAAPLLRLEMEGQLNVSVAMMEIPAGTQHTLFVGSVKSARARKSMVTLKVAALSGALSRKLPRFAYQTRCNHTLFNFGCARRRTAEMAESAWMYTGTIAYQWDVNAPRVVLTSFAAPSGKPTLLNDLEGYFAGGWLEIGWDTPQRQIREVVWSGTHTQTGDPDRLFLDMYRVLRGDVAGLPVRFWPGCDGSFNTCIAKFGNQVNFGGFPHQPAWIEQAAMGMPKGGK